MVLEVVIAACSPVIVAFDDEVIDESLALRAREHLSRWEEPVLEVPDGLLAAFEARQVVLSQEHHFNDDDDLLGVLLECHEALLHQLSVFAEVLRSVAAEHLNLLRCELEGSLLKLHALAWCVREEESKVNVHYVAFNVNHDISIVSVLDLKDVAKQGVGGQRFAEIVASCFVRLAPG